MYRLAFKSFIRSRSVMVALVLFFAVGLISIYIGKQYLEKQQSAIAAVTSLQQEQIERNVRYVPDQFGLLMYYLRFAYINKPDPIAALAIGQQDINSSIQYLTIRGLEAQRYDTDLFNPYNQLTGNFDLSFVILFLFPLLIIAFNFNLVSMEKESGTWSLVKTQAGRPLIFVLQKLGIRFAVVQFLLLLLLVSAVLVIGIPFNAKLLAFSITSFAYITVWFAIVFFLVSLHQNTSNTALLALSSWVLVCLLAPAMTNNYVTSRYPVHEAYSTFLKQRDGYHTRWDSNTDSTMTAFFKRYPQFKEYKWNSSKFNYLWYYAMQQMGDEESMADSKAMTEKLWQRQKISTRIASLFPPMQAQLQFTNISGTGLSQHLQYLESTASFHEKTKLHFYPKIFSDSPVTSENWQQHVPQYFRMQSDINWMSMLMPLLVSIALLGLSGAYLFSKKI